MLKVFKDRVPEEDKISLDLPNGAQVLKVDVQNNEVQLWGLIDPSVELQTRWFRFAGHPIDQNMAELKHISTFFMHEGALVFHVFEILGHQKNRKETKHGNKKIPSAGCANRNDRQIAHGAKKR